MKKSIVLFFAALIGVAVSAVELIDPEFAKLKDGALVCWKNANNAPVKVENGVVTMTSVKAKLYDSIFQGRRITPSDALYVFSVDVDSPINKAAFLQIKMFVKGKEVVRRSSSTAKIGKSRIFVAATHPQADVIEIAMRVAPNGAGKNFKFSNPKLSIAEDGALFGTWLPGGKGFSVSGVSDNCFTINIDKAEKYHTSMGFFSTVTPGKKYVFESNFKSDLPKMAYLEVKYYNKGKELKRKQTYSTTSEGTLSVEVNSDGCDKVLLQCRVPASAAYVGKKVTFSNFKFKEVK